MNGNGEKQDMLSRLRLFMVSMETPEWLIEKSMKVLEVQERRMGGDDLYEYLEGLGQSTNNSLPSDFMNENWLRSVYRSHRDWVDKEADFYVGVTYKFLATHIEESPRPIQGFNQDAQKTYVAISSHLLNVFSQISDIKHAPEPEYNPNPLKEGPLREVENVKEKDDSSVIKKGIYFLLSVIGYIIIVWAYVMGMASFTLLSEEGQLVTIITYFLVGMIPFVIGLALIRKATFRNFFKQRSFRIYCYGTIVVPIGILIYYYIMDLKKTFVMTGDTVYLRLVSSSTIEFFAIFLMFIIIMVAAPIVVNKTGRKKFVIAEAILCIVLIGFHLIIPNEYEMITTDKVMKYNFESEQVYELEDVNVVHLSGRAYKRNSDSGVREMNFYWSFEFVMDNGDTVTFDEFRYNEEDIKDSIEIRNKMDLEQIPFEISPLSEEASFILKIEMADEDPALETEFFKFSSYN